MALEPLEVAMKPRATEPPPVAVVWLPTAVSLPVVALDEGPMAIEPDPAAVAWVAAASLTATEPAPAAAPLPTFRASAGVVARPAPDTARIDAAIRRARAENRLLKTEVPTVFKPIAWRDGVWADAKELARCVLGP